MKKIIKVVCSFAIAMTTACGVICAVASAANPNSTTGKYAYMSGVIDYSSKDKGVVSVKNTSGTTRYISIKSYVLGNNAGSVASGKWIRQSKENAGKFSASATIRKNKSSTSTVLETLNLTVY